MTLFLALAGAVLVAIALADAIVTTLAAGNGGGPLTTRLTEVTWRGLRAVTPGRASKVLAFSGTIVLLVTVLAWVTLLWAGWSLIFLSAVRAVVDAMTSAPASVAARVYYAGFVVFTLGIGDVVPGSGTWQVATAVASFLGLFLVTLSITYLLSVVSAAVTRRALAREIHLSGLTDIDIVALHLAGDRVSSQFSSLVQTLCTQILQTTQQHLAYPVLHHFHARDDHSSAPRALSALDDALLIMSAALPEQERPSSDTLTRLRRAIEHYATTVGGSGQGQQDPPLPDLALLRAAGVPVVADAQFVDAAAEHLARRRQLEALVRADAGTWPEHPRAGSR